VRGQLARNGAAGDRAHGQRRRHVTDGCTLELHRDLAVVAGVERLALAAVVDDGEGGVAGEHSIVNRAALRVADVVDLHRQHLRRAQHHVAEGLAVLRERQLRRRRRRRLQVGHRQRLQVGHHGRLQVGHHVQLHVGHHDGGNVVPATTDRGEGNQQRQRQNGTARSHPATPSHDVHRRCRHSRSRATVVSPPSPRRMRQLR
jgi:hypothetical protein